MNRRDRFTWREGDVDVIVVVVPPDDELHRDVVAFQHSLAAGFDYLAAVVEARFAVIRAGLRMTGEVVDHE